MAAPAKPAPRSPDLIRRTAATLFAERGYHATTMRALGTALGITAPSLYNHYSEKQEILFDIALNTMLALIDGGREAVAEDDPPDRQLRAFIAAHVEFHAERRVEAFVADTELRALEPKNRKRVIEVRDIYEDMLRDILRRGRDQQGWVVADEAVISFAIFAMATGVVAWYRPGGRLSPQDVAQIYSDFTIGALLSDAP